MKLRVAGMQMRIGDDVDANEARITSAIDRAAREKAEILLTPEGSLSGYRHEFDQAEVQGALARVTQHARERRVGLALGTCFVERGGRCYNQIRFYRPDGKYLGFHSKTLTCGTLERKPRGEIRRFAVSRLRTFRWSGRSTFGALICNDLWANPLCTPMDDPHLTQRLARMQARVIFHAVNAAGGVGMGRDWARMFHRYHESNLRMRAWAGRVWIVTADCSPGRQAVVSPSGVIGPDGKWACRARPVGEQLFVADLDLGKAA
jgi:predicted amidohydrolase